MGFKDLIRSLWLDWLGQREDRYYWRQSQDKVTLSHGSVLCLWMADGKLGDAVVNSTLLASLHRARPDVRVLVVCSPGLQALWSRVPGVAQVVVALGGPRPMSLALLDAARGPVDVLVSFETFVSAEVLQMLQCLRPTLTIGFSVGHYRAFHYSLVDTTYQFPRRHISDRLRNLCELLQLPYHSASDLAQSLGISRSGEEAWPPKRCFLNVCGAAAHRSFTPDTVRELLAMLARRFDGLQVTLNVPAGERSAWLALTQEPVHQGTVTLAPEGMSLQALFGHVGQADLVLTPDTAIGHIAAALNRPVLVFFADAHYNPVVWCPMGSLTRCVLPDGGAGHVNEFSRPTVEAVLCGIVATAPCKYST